MLILQLKKIRYIFNDIPNLKSYNYSVVGYGKSSGNVWKLS